MYISNELNLFFGGGGVVYDHTCITHFPFILTESAQGGAPSKLGFQLMLFIKYTSRDTDLVLNKKSSS